MRIGKRQVKIRSINVGRKGHLIKAATEEEAATLKAIAIQDAPSEIDEEQIRLAGFMIAKRTGPEGVGLSKGGQVILIREEEKTDYEVLGEWTGNGGSTGTMIKLRIDGIKPIYIGNMYIRPRSSHEETEKALKWLNETTPEISKTIIVGDFNASNWLWEKIERAMENNREGSEKHYLQIKEARGRQICNFISHNKMICLNAASKKTTCGKNVIDLAIVGTKIYEAGLKQLNVQEIKGNNDHKMVEITNRIRHRVQEMGGRSTIRRIRTERIHEEMFLDMGLLHAKAIEGYQEARIDTSQRHKILDELSRALYEKLRQVQNSITVTRTKVRRRGDMGRSKERRRIREVKRRIREHKVAKAAMTKVERRRHKAKLQRIERRINRDRNDIINRRLGVDKRMDLWKRIDRREGNQNGDTGAMASSEALLGTKLENEADLNRISREKFPKIDRATTAEYITYGKRQGLEVEEREIAQAIKDVRTKQYTSPQGIKMKVFNQCVRFTEQTIKTIITESFRTNYIPKPCRLTKGTIIPKRGRSAYRIVHVSNPLAAVMEMIALHRLEHELESRHLTSPQQFGFTAARDRHDLLARIIEITMRKRELNEKGKRADFTTLISMDIEGAFDNINQDQISRKLVRELGDENGLGWWLSSFVLNREIVLEYKGMRSKPRMVQKGVPQGSALGPILFNFAINDIDHAPERVTKYLDVSGRKEGDLGQIEVTKYADDIMIIQRGYDKKELQTAVDNLVHNLRQLELRLVPSKCAVITIKRNMDTRNRREPMVRIEGEEIKRVKTLSILGVTIKNDLTLDRGGTTRRIKEAMRRLTSIYGMDIVHSAKEWRVLLDSLLISRLITNNLPILTLSRHDREWTDAQFIRMAKILFNWPKNVSNGIIRIVTGQERCYDTVAEYILNKSIGPMKETFELLGRLLEISEATGHASKIEHRMMSMSTMRRREKQSHANPEHFIGTGDTRERQIMVDSSYLNTSNEARKGLSKEHIGQILSASGILGKWEETGERPGWIIFSGRGHALGIQIDKGRIVSIRRARHEQYPISYFNTMALIWALINEESTDSREIIINKEEAIVKAITNNRSKDWRIIRLRRRLMEEGWKITKIGPKKELGFIRSLIIEWASDRERGSTRGLEEMRQYNEQEINAEWTQGQSKRKRTEPDVSDYARRYRIRTDKQEAVESEIGGLLSRTMIKLTGRDTTVWREIPPNWLSGSKMLMLSDMIKCSRTGELIKDRNGRERCGHCGETEEPTVMEHRVQACTKYDKQRDRIRSVTNNYGNIKEVLENRMHAQTLLKILATIALK